MNIHPPKWAGRFLAWYCNPDLLEEIQGDAQELYSQRIKAEGKRAADFKYIWDVLRFCRWSNIKRTEHGFVPGSMGGLWNMNFKMALRNANKNKLIFAVKTIGLSVCLAFALLLTAFVVSELSFDTFHTQHNRIYRVGFKVNFADHVVDYAVTPLPMGQALAEGIPEIEGSFRFMHEGKPAFKVGDNLFSNETTLAADSNFLKILSFEFIKGDNHALDEANKIVLTETTARKFFGDKDPIGEQIEFGRDFLVEVAAVIKDVPVASHLKFDALLSWDTFDRNDSWANINAYNYILLKPGASIAEIENKAPAVLGSFNELIMREYKASYKPHFDNIADIHFSGKMDEDIAEKRDKSSLIILIAVIVLFLITGFINYLNLTLAELTANLKRIGIVRVFGGLAEGHRKILLMETLLTLLIVLPLAGAFTYTGLLLASQQLGIQIDQHILLSPSFVLSASGFMMLLFASTRVNSYVLSKTSHLIHSLQGKFNSSQSGLTARKYLVASQLCFSIIMIALIIVIVDQFNFIQNADKGFNDKNTIVVSLRSHDAMRIESFTEEVKKIQGISSAEGSSYYPGIIETKDVFEVETSKGMEQHDVPMMICSDKYLEKLDIKLVKGRGFRENSTDDHYRAYIINETAARAFGWQNAIGKKIKGPVSDGAIREGEVVGVVKDFNFASLHEKIDPLIIFPFDGGWGIHFIYIKLDALHAPDAIAAIEKQYKTQWPDLPFEWEYLDAKYTSLYKNDYEMKMIFETGLIISVLISCLGIFSISALLVTLRTKEMGIRKVVGASAVQLFFLHTKSFLQFLLISIVVAWPVIWYLSDMWLQNFAYHVKLNAWYFILPGIIALFITFITSGYHGIKSSLVNTVDVLKYE